MLNNPMEEGIDRGAIFHERFIQAVLVENANKWGIGCSGCQCWQVLWRAARRSEDVRSCCRAPRRASVDSSQLAVRVARCARWARKLSDNWSMAVETS